MASCIVKPCVQNVLTIMIYIRHKIYLWQSQVEIERYSVAYFDRVTAFKEL